MQGEQRGKERNIEKDIANKTKKKEEEEVKSKEEKKEK